MKRLLSILFAFSTSATAFAQTAQFTIKAITSSVLEVYFRPQGAIGPVTTGISNLTFVLQIPQTFPNPQGQWTVTPNSTYLGTGVSSTATSTANGSRYNTLFSWTSNPNINNTSFADGIEYLLVTLSTPSGVTASNVTLADWGNNRLDNAASGAPLWATSIAIDGLDRTNNTAIFYGNASTSAPNNSGSVSLLSTLSPNGTPLSANLIDFSVKPVKENALLSWTTDNETDTKLYELEYKTEQTPWEQVGQVMALNSGRSVYTFSHPFANAEQHFYRLKVVANNGEYFYSKILSLRQDMTSEPAKLYPSVVHSGETVQLSLSKSTSPKLLKITDNNGRLVKTLNTQEGRINIETGDLSSGNYFIVILSEEKIQTLRFLVL